MRKFSVKLLFAFFVGSAACLNASCSYLKPIPNITELASVLKQHHLRLTDPHFAGQQEVAEIEEADSTLYQPVACDILFLLADASVAGDRNLRPRHWLVVEDYRSVDLARKRAVEYNTTDAYERVAKAYGRGATSHMISKMTVRRWAVARGRRVYALTTNVMAFAEDALVGKLKESISGLPET